MKIAIVIGHTKNSPGACADSTKSGRICEYEYNEELAYMIAAKIDVDIIYRETYKSLPDKINACTTDIIISLHCNAFNTKATGTETLYYYKSTKGKELATKLQKAIVDALGLADRGIKPKTAEDRGGYLLKYTRAPCVILEPFFIDNPNDLAIDKQLLATTIADVLISLH